MTTNPKLRIEDVRAALAVMLAEPPAIFGTLEDVVAMARPIGQSRAARILHEHPDAPKPVLGGKVAGSKAIYSIEAGRAFWLAVARDGLPPELQG